MQEHMPTRVHFICTILTKIVSFLNSKGVGKRTFALKRAGDMLKDNVKAQMVIRCQEDC